MGAVRYLVDPLDPRSPAQAIWDALDEQDRQGIISHLPSEIERATPPEGDPHRLSKTRALEALREYFERLHRRIYLSSELPVYYPEQPMFAPDLLAVRDVEPHPRAKWVVSQERRGLDFVLEIHVGGSTRKDFEDNVAFLASLGIPEYFVFDPVRQRLLGWELPSPAARTYTPIIPQEGRWASRVLELDVALDAGGLRFFHGSAALPDASELIRRLSTMVTDATRRAEEETRRAEDEARRATRLAARLRELGVDPDENAG